MKIGLAFLFLIAPYHLTFSQRFNDARFEQAATKLEQDAQELRDQVERLYANRCDSALSDCYQTNYHECLSQFPNPTCPARIDFRIDQCAGPSADSTISGFYDFTASNIRLPPETITQRQTEGATGNAIDTGSPTDPNLIETVCFTRDLDTWFQQKRQRDAPFWQQFGFAPRSMYFGSHTGAFRIYPGRHSQQCGIYDPRIRPWYVAGSSGQKNVILILDTSGSMKGIRINLMKEAAIRIIDTLTVGDRIAIVPFSDKAQIIGDRGGVLYTATLNNRATLKRAVQNLRAEGATNFLDAFTTAFDVLDKSIEQEFHVSCNTAILFLTDGEMTQPPGITEADVLQLINERQTMTLNRLGNDKPILLFTYSISENDDNDVHTFPSELACSSPFGIWSKITDTQELVISLSSYYLLFALGLGSDSNQDFAAWVEPYLFATGNVMGTTVSVPVYDRTKSPHLFLGVVGVDIALDALDAALGANNNDNDGGGGGSNAESIRRIAIRSTARCPVLNLTVCELESYRQGTSGEESLCHNKESMKRGRGNNTVDDDIVCLDVDFVQTQAEKCGGISDYPRDVIANRELAGQSYTEKVCCDTISGEATIINIRRRQKIGIIVGAVFISLFFILCGVCYIIALFI